MHNVFIQQGNTLIISVVTSLKTPFPYTPFICMARRSTASLHTDTHLFPNHVYGLSLFFSNCVCWSASKGLSCWGATLRLMYIARGVDKAGYSRYHQCPRPKLIYGMALPTLVGFYVSLEINYEQQMMTMALGNYCLWKVQSWHAAPALFVW